MSVLTGVRNATLDDMVALLQTQQAAKLDVVAPVTALTCRDGFIELTGADPVIDEAGVTPVDGRYLPTVSADGDLAEKLDISRRYLRHLRDIGRVDLFDVNINGKIHGRVPGSDSRHEPDQRKFLLRTFRGDPGGPGVLRAVLSDRFGICDNFDVLTAVLDGINQAGTPVTIRSCDLTDSAMHVKVYSPAVAQLAPALLANYRNPFATPQLADDRTTVTTPPGRPTHDAPPPSDPDLPVMFAGFRFSNSETGHGAVVLKPELYVRVCGNGLTLPMLAVRDVHLGSRLKAGAVAWSQDTYDKQLAVVTAKTRDTVQHWLSPEFLAEQIALLGATATTPVTEPGKTITVIAKQMRFSDAERTGILSHFIAGGQLNAAGIANAITSFSQTLADPTRADTLDDLAVEAMALA
ncbi:hypothetical protein NONI108955_23325 [Nocardia ninae]|uniref:DUF932 domain-containing protein n=1 Tax=Nocardia ninae NBRC 108245 TaxID=1210091 RepID=A0A511MSE5_9NOCA|nr:hypothetical protein [Nocardia ninae]GEM42966.1 hypothetical protein NN4_74850 [Nocardia ninae NBRC 108245]